jgi:hypothetical protein
MVHSTLLAACILISDSYRTSTYAGMRHHHAVRIVLINTHLQVPCAIALHDTVCQLDSILTILMVVCCTIDVLGQHVVY